MRASKFEAFFLQKIRVKSLRKRLRKLYLQKFLEIRSTFLNQHDTTSIVRKRTCASSR